MSKNFRPLIAPFIAVLAIMLQLVFGIELNEELQSEIATNIANLFAIGIVVYSLFKGHMKKEKKEVLEK